MLSVVKKIFEKQAQWNLRKLLQVVETRMASAHSLRQMQTGEVYVSKHSWSSHCNLEYVHKKDNF